MGIKTRSIDDSSEVAAAAADVAADDADLPNASFPIAIGTPVAPKEIPVANLMEYIRDSLVAFITAGSNISITHDDAANTLTVTATDTNTQRTDEEIRDLIAGFITEGSNVTVSHDDANDTLTITATDTNTQKSDEAIRDLIAGFITGGSNVTVSHDDAGNTLTIKASTPGPTLIIDRHSSPIGDTTGGSGNNYQSISGLSLSSTTYRYYTLVVRLRETDVDETDGGSDIGWSYASTPVPSHLFNNSGEKIRVDTKDNSWCILKYQSSSNVRVFVKESGTDECKFVALYGQK
ncbi:MAG: hypothetical protein V6Z81_06505 [Parvularculales bacterium]